MDGILVIRKEKGYTSHDVVAKLRGILHMKKIGHTGTLDPAAEGVLPVALGKGTRLVELLTEKEKTYEAVLRLGVSTDTQDMTGAVLSEKPVTVTEEEVREAVGSFVGEQQQVPPMYSALKVNGKKLYELAREGKTIERKITGNIWYKGDIGRVNLNAKSKENGFLSDVNLKFLFSTEKEKFKFKLDSDILNLEGKYEYKNNLLFVNQDKNFELKYDVKNNEINLLKGYINSKLDNYTVRTDLKCRDKTFAEADLKMKEEILKVLLI